MSTEGLAFTTGLRDWSRAEKTLQRWYYACAFGYMPAYAGVAYANLSLWETPISPAPIPVWIERSLVLLFAVIVLSLLFQFPRYYLRGTVEYRIALRANRLLELSAKSEALTEVVGDPDTYSTIRTLASLKASVLRLATKTGRMNSSLAGIGLEHATAVNRGLDDLALRVSRAGMTYELRRDLAVGAISLTDAAVGGTPCALLPQSLLSDGGSGEQRMQQASRVADIIIALVVFVALASVAASIILIGGGEAIAIAILVVGTVLLIIHLPRGTESLSWLRDLLPGTYGSSSLRDAMGATGQSEADSRNRTEGDATSPVQTRP
jgi:hypothetical protein